MPFARFKAGEPARVLYSALGVPKEIQLTARSWGQLRSLVVDWNDQDIGRLVAAAREWDGVCSSGERTLLHAFLYAMDFAWLADELANGQAWRRMSSVSGEYHDAVVDLIELKD